MAEVTHTSSAIYSLGRAVGRGPRLVAANVVATQDETFDTGLDTLEAFAVSNAIESTAPTSAFLLVSPKSVSGGTITLNVRTVTLTEATDTSRVFGNATDKSVYIIAVGNVRGI